MVQAKNEGYLGNNLIKRAGVETSYTEEQLIEYQNYVFFKWVEVAGQRRLLNN